MEQLDARAQACPIPVVRAKKALSSMAEGTLEVLVDNQSAVHNLEALAKSLQCVAASEQRGESEFAVVIEKRAESGEAAVAPSPADVSSLGEQVVVIASEFMGSGDDALGKTLMRGFFFALTQQDELPGALMLYNGGVKWACEGSQALDDLRALEEAGTRVLSCGTCLENYALTEQLAVGEVTNMYVIVEKQMAARLVIRP